MARGREGNVAGSEDLWVARKVGGEWQKAEHLPAPINTEHNEVCPWLTADGKQLYFARMVFEGSRLAEHHIAPPIPLLGRRHIRQSQVLPLLGKAIPVLKGKAAQR
jgi:hypothetical protein